MPWVNVDADVNIDRDTDEVENPLEGLDEAATRDGPGGIGVAAAGAAVSLPQESREFRPLEFNGRNSAIFEGEQDPRPCLKLSGLSKQEDKCIAHTHFVLLCS